MDRFASDRNNKFPRFNSKYTFEGAEGIDAFMLDWSRETNRLVPPPQLVPRVLDHLKNCHTRGILVMPFWPLAKFWPFLFTWQGPAFAVSAELRSERGLSTLLLEISQDPFSCQIYLKDPYWGLRWMCHNSTRHTEQVTRQRSGSPKNFPTSPTQNF